MCYMATQLDEIRARLKRAAAARKRAEASLESAREELSEAIVEASLADMKQVEIVNISGYNREHIRRIVIAARGGQFKEDDGAQG
jgi:hypothetical protein